MQKDLKTWMLPDRASKESTSLVLVVRYSMSQNTKIKDVIAHKFIVYLLLQHAEVAATIETANAYIKPYTHNP